MKACLLLKRQGNITTVPEMASSSHLCPGTRIFASIGNIFGHEELESARRWETFALRVSSTYAQIQFLHRCLDNHVLPKSLSYRLPVNTSLARRWVTQHGRRIIRALLQDCHLRLRKYNGVLRQEVTKCTDVIGEDGVTLLQQVIDRRARELRAKRDVELAAKLRSISHSSPEENEILVHNMSSKQLTPAQLKVLSHEACFNTTDADPVNLVATVESILKQTGESDETAHLIWQKVTSLVMAHKPRAIITRAEQSALRALRTDTSIVILPADKGRSTVVLDKADYVQKANALLEDRQAYLPCGEESIKKLVTQLGKTLADMQSNKAISKSVRLAIKPTDAAPPRFYGLPKVHKAGLPPPTNCFVARCTNI
ncbi:hypothetical protein SprV_0902658900 [Sparganum proliferum]